MRPTPYLIPHCLTRTLALQTTILAQSAHLMSGKLRLRAGTRLICGHELRWGRIGTRNQISWALPSRLLTVHPQGDQTRAVAPLDWSQSRCDCGPSCEPQICLSLALAFQLLFHYLQSAPLYSQQERAQGRGRVGRGPGVSGSPSPILEMRKLTHPSVSDLLRVTWQVCGRTRVDGAQAQPGGRCCRTCNRQRGAVERPPAWEPGNLCPVLDSARHRVTLDKSCPLPGVQPHLLYGKRVALSRGPLSFLLNAKVSGLDLALEL